MEHLLKCHRSLRNAAARALFWQQRQPAKEELDVHVAVVRHLRNVFAGPPQVVLAADMSPKLLAAVICVRVVRSLHKKPAAATADLTIGARDAEVPEVTAGHSSLFFAIVFKPGTLIVANVLNAVLIWTKLSTDTEERRQSCSYVQDNSRREIP